MQDSYMIHCDNTIDGLLTALYDGFVIKKRLGDAYDDCISICIGSGQNYSLFSTWLESRTDPKKASLTASTIYQQLGADVYAQVFRTLCHYEEDRGTILMGFLVRAFKEGPSILDHLSDPYVMRVLELSRKCGNESHLFHGFVRFTQLENTLYSRIEPKCNVLPILSPHFNDRLPEENWIIYDATHKIGSIHKAGDNWFLMDAPSLLDIDLSSRRKKDPFHALWRSFFQSIAIEERENPRCQNTLIPKWYRRNMDEFL